jgi:hypothetical protein
MFTAIPTKNREKFETRTDVASFSKYDLFEILNDLYLQSNKINQKIASVKTALELKVLDKTPISDLVSYVCNSSSEVLNQNEIDTYKQKRIYAMKEEQIFVNTDLNLNNLALILQFPVHKVPKLINQEFHQNSYDFVNSYSLLPFLQKDSNEKNNKFTILGLTYDSGFAYKTVSNTYYKKKTGKTPNQYLNEVNKNSIPV